MVIALSQQLFDRIGCLTTARRGDIAINPITSDRSGTLAYLGPFDNGKEYYAAWAREYLRLFADGQMFARYPVNAYLIFKHFAQLAVDGEMQPIRKPSWTVALSSRSTWTTKETTYSWTKSSVLPASSIGPLPGLSQHTKPSARYR